MRAKTREADVKKGAAARSSKKLPGAEEDDSAWLEERDTRPRTVRRHGQGCAAFTRLCLEMSDGALSQQPLSECIQHVAL